MRTFLAAVALLVLSASAASAAQALPDECEKIKGTITCVDPVGNSEESDGHSQTVDTSDKGDLKNPQKFQCSGPGASSSGC
jgi:opacity protein-like surface antigen